MTTKLETSPLMRTVVTKRPSKPAPWNEPMLRSKCESINSQMGSRGIGYENLLEALEESGSKDAKKLGDNFFFILSNMPEELIERPSILPTVQRLFERFKDESIIECVAALKAMPKELAARVRNQTES